MVILNHSYLFIHANSKPWPCPLGYHVLHNSNGEQRKKNVVVSQGVSSAYFRDLGRGVKHTY